MFKRHYFITNLIKLFSGEQNYESQIVQNNLNMLIKKIHECSLYLLLNEWIINTLPIFSPQLYYELKDLVSHQVFEIVCNLTLTYIYGHDKWSILSNLKFLYDHHEIEFYVELLNKYKFCRALLKDAEVTQPKNLAKNSNILFFLFFLE